MKNRIQKWRYLGLSIVFLAVLVASCLEPFGSYQSAHAQVAKPAATALSGLSRGAAWRSSGKVIVVSLSQQWLYAYQNGQLVFDTAVLTGRPSLPTPTGTYRIFAKRRSITFRSPWRRSSPYYYSPTHINYAMEWRAGGYYLHDSWWHTVYGPGTNVRHYDPTYGWQTGSHGCISMPLSAAAWLYRWAPLGTIVRVVR
jgi:lipoprotein-anchoring transpeptidase ErfK/SrfK